MLLLCRYCQGEVPLGNPTSLRYFCSNNHRYDANYMMNPDGTVMLSGRPDIVIPANRVLVGTLLAQDDGSTRGGPNPTGHAVIWYLGNTFDPGGSNIFCFSTGPLAHEAYQQLSAVGAPLPPRRHCYALSHLRGGDHGPAPRERRPQINIVHQFRASAPPCPPDAWLSDP